MIDVYKLIGKKDLTYLGDAEILKNKIKEVLDNIIDYTQSHFTFEESLQEDRKSVV